MARVSASRFSATSFAEWTDMVARPREPLDKVKQGIPRWANGIESMPIPGSITMPRGSSQKPYTWGTRIPCRSRAVRTRASCGENENAVEGSDLDFVPVDGFPCSEFGDTLLCYMVVEELY